MSIGNATDLPDWTVGTTLQGNTLVNTDSTHGLQYNGPVLGVAGAPSMTIYGGCTIPTTGLVTVIVEWFPTVGATVPTFIQSSQFKASGSLALAIPCLFPYAVIDLSSSGTGVSWVLEAFLSNVSVTSPTTLRRGVIGANSSVAVGTGNTTFAFPIVAPGPCDFTYFLGGGAGFFEVVDFATGQELWSSGGLSGAAQQNGNGSAILTPNQCGLLVSNSSGASQTVAYGFVC